MKNEVQILIKINELLHSNNESAKPVAYVTGYNNGLVNLMNWIYNNEL